VALCAALAMPEGEVPDWSIYCRQGQSRPGWARALEGCKPRGADRRRIGRGEHLVVDENHSTDLAVPKGEPAAARGWIVALEPRADGVWSQVEWTAEGKALVAGKAYRAIPPVIKHLADGTVTVVPRASLDDQPNLRSLATLHQESDMNPCSKSFWSLAPSRGSTKGYCSSTGSSFAASTGLIADCALANARCSSGESLSFTLLKVSVSSWRVFNWVAT
jgi:hypothetical protein